MEDCDAAIIMVDLADQASIENAVSWYSPFSQSSLPSNFFSQLMSDNIEEILSSQQHSHHSTSLPVVIYSWKAYEKINERAMDPTKIVWSDELSDTPFFYIQYLDLNEKSNRITASQNNRRPIGWILEQLTSQVGVVCLLISLLPATTLLPQHAFTFSLGILPRLLPG